MPAAKKRIAVVGGGVVGAAIAWRLSERGANVTVIDTEDPASSASRGSHAWLNVSSTRDAHYASLRARSLRIWHKLARLPGCPVAFSGSFLWSRRYGGLAAHAAWLSDLGWQAEILSSAGLAQRQPWIAEAPPAALHLPDEGIADPRRVGSWLLAQARANGASTTCGHVETVEHGVRLSDGTQIPADTVVLAAGVATAGLAAPLGANLSVERLPGLLVRSRPAAPLATGYIATDNVHFWQDADGSILAGAEYDGADRVDAPEERAAQILQNLERLYRAANRLSTAEILIRDRPVPADGFPIVGHLPSAPDVYVAVMHSGMTLAPLIGELAARELLDGRPQPILSRYRPR